MKILLDSNVALDAVLKREPFYDSAANVIGLSQGVLVCLFRLPP
jgi:hypothetical protein